MNESTKKVLFNCSTLLYILEYLNIQELLKAGSVCKMWNDATNHRSLWKTVQMNVFKIRSFKGMGNALQKHNTKHLGLYTTSSPGDSIGNIIWKEFLIEIQKVQSLRAIRLSGCPTVVIEQLSVSNPKLQIIYADSLTCKNINLSQIARLDNLKELRLHFTSGFLLMSKFTDLSKLKQLVHLSLTSIQCLNTLNIEVIADLENLESLELGHCLNLRKTFGSQILMKLVKLEKLQLHTGYGSCYSLEILKAVKNMPRLKELELVNFEIRDGFDKALGACTNIKKLLIIVSSSCQNPRSNNMILRGVSRLQSTLLQFEWGMNFVCIVEVEFCSLDGNFSEGVKKPVDHCLNPITRLREEVNKILQAEDPEPSDEYLPFPLLVELLKKLLPTTRVEFLKLPFLKAEGPWQRKHIYLF